MRFLSVLMLVGSIFCANAYAADRITTNVPLRAKYNELTKQLNNNQFKRPLYLNSVESSTDLKGEIYAVLDYPFATVNQALNNPAHWCDVLILHINIKYCHAGKNKNGTTLTVNLGKKNAQPLPDTYRVNFDYQEIITTPDYFALELNAENGPLNTRNYRIWVEATPVKGGRTFLHFTYAYSFGMAGRLAMQGYLATVGSDKVGFTVTGKSSDGNQNYIKGVRGVVERNTMRYYLAIDSYLSHLTAPANAQLEQRLQTWYRLNEEYPRQLHEVELDEYLTMKRDEYKRQQTVN
jgi:hypothetical protein